MSWLANGRGSVRVVAGLGHEVRGSANVLKANNPHLQLCSLQDRAPIHIRRPVSVRWSPVSRRPCKCRAAAFAVGVCRDFPTGSCYKGAVKR